MGYCCRIFTPVQPVYPAASVRDFVSGALTLDSDLLIVTQAENISTTEMEHLVRSEGGIYDPRAGGVLYAIESALADYFAEDNGFFDRERFIRACRGDHV